MVCLSKDLGLSKLIFYIAKHTDFWTSENQCSWLPEVYWLEKRDMIDKLANLASGSIKLDLKCFDLG